MTVRRKIPVVNLVFESVFQCSRYKTMVQRIYPRISAKHLPQACFFGLIKFDREKSGLKKYSEQYQSNVLFFALEQVAMSSNNSHRCPPSTVWRGNIPIRLIQESDNNVKV